MRTTKAANDAGRKPGDEMETLLHLPSLVAEVEAQGSTIAAYREAFAKARKAIDCLFKLDIPAAELLAWQSAVTDALIVHLWNQHIDTPTTASLSLLAVGGYGRAELHPNSDIDILILTADDYTDADEQLGAFITALWDTGLDIGHSVRDIPRSIQEALADVTVVTNLLQSRLLSGSRSLYARLKDSIAPDKVWGVADFFVAKRNEQIDRHIKFHGSAYRLEPNLKESPGGLRDIQTIEWLVIRLFGSGDLNALVSKGYLTEPELADLTEGRDHLWRIRYLLHIKSGRKEDRLLFDYQRELAGDFGYHQEGNEAVEQFMQVYYRTVTKVERLNGMLLQLFEDRLLNNPSAQTVVPINKRFQITNSYLDVTSDRVFRDYPPAILEMFQVFAASEAIKGIGATTLRLLSSHLHLIDRRFRNELTPRDLFLQLFREPQKITRKLRLMNRYGVLAAYLPEFEKIVGRMQYDLFHIYTVDEHTLMVIRNLRRFALPEHNEEYPQCSEIMQQIDKPELLYLVGLFHDIAKGRGGDHSILGAEDAEQFCRHHGLTAVDTKLVTWTIRHHLAMSTTAQRKDISDPEIISDFAHFVGSLRYLNFLYLLTVADIRGTNPELWNSWKANLLHQLYSSTKLALKRGLDNPIDKQEIIDERKSEARWLMNSLATAGHANTDMIDAIWQDCDENYFLQYSADEICWHTSSIAQHESTDPLIVLRRETRRGSTEIFIYVDDYDEIFVDIATSLEKLSLTVVSADILSSRHRKTLNTFYVLDKDGETIGDNSRLEHIHRVLMQALDTAGDLLNRPKPMPAPRRLRHFEFNPIIEFDNNVSDDYTSLFIKAIDRPGLLSAIGYSFAENSIRVASANITTLGETAEDAFHIQNLDRSKVINKQQLDRLRDSLMQHIEGE